MRYSMQRQSQIDLLTKDIDSDDVVDHRTLFEKLCGAQAAVKYAAPWHRKLKFDSGRRALLMSAADIGTRLAVFFVCRA